MEKELEQKIQSTTINVSMLRGLVITNAVSIEAFIGAIIANYFVKSDKHSDFSTTALSDPFFSFGLKVNILRKIMRKINFSHYKTFRDDLDKMWRLRNRFAHSMMFGFDGELIYDKGENPMEKKKAKEMYDEFILLYPKVMGELEKLFWHIIGKPRPVSEK
ncbi:MAG: hypothetical protein AABX64_02800 [Nanoarchaeota archaeon]